MQETTILEKGNKGEKDETKCKRNLFINRQDREFCILNFGYDAEDGIEIINNETNEPYKSTDEIKKTKASSKADVIILFNKTQEKRYCSIKSKCGAPPSILNHTPRSAHVFQTECFQDVVVNLDILAKEYIDKRKKGIICEDIEINKLESFHNESIKQSIIKLVLYFVFKGTGSKKSDQECNSVIIINKDGSIKYISCITEEEKETYIQTIIDKCVISFRNKGMPNVDKTSALLLCEPWIFKNKDNKDCGSIHIRLAR